MHLVTKIRQYQYRKRLEKETGRVNQRLQLPVELLELIFGHIDDDETLYTLCDVSKTITSIVAPKLFRVLQLELDEWLLPIPRFFPLQRLSIYIVELEITLCSEIVVDPPKRTPRYYTRLERLAGAIVMGCLNLEMLRIACHIGDAHITKLDFLARLPTERLMELFVYCTCANPAIDVQSIISAPCMRNVTKLTWLPSPKRTPLNIPRPGMTIMPNLSILYINEWSEVIEMAYERPVTRLYLHFFDERVVRLVQHHASNMTALDLVIDENKKQSNMFQAFLREVTPQLTRLKFFGRLTLHQGSIEALFEDVKKLKNLAPTIVFLAFNTQSQEIYRQFIILLPRIQALFPKLRIILGMDDHALARRGAGDWIRWDTCKTPVPFYDVQDHLEILLERIPSTTYDDPEAGVVIIRP